MEGGNAAQVEDATSDLPPNTPRINGLQCTLRALHDLLEMPLGLQRFQEVLWVILQEQLYKLFHPLAVCVLLNSRVQSLLEESLLFEWFCTPDLVREATLHAEHRQHSSFGQNVLQRHVGI